MFDAVTPGAKVINWFDQTLREINEFGLLGPLRIRLTAAIIDRIPKVKLGWSYLWVMASPRVTWQEWDARNLICDECPIMRTQGDKRYCGGCGCGQRKDAELSAKNWRQAHNCPLGKHPGSVALIQLNVEPMGEGI